MEKEIKMFEKEIDKEKRFYLRFKRITDVLMSIVIFIVTSPVLMISLLVVYLQDFKNPIYAQERVGLNNSEFKIYKIRSMVHNAEKNGARWASKNDARITPFGRFIRKTRIDELPQLINVIKGEMSLIGPRPEREIFYKEFEKTVPDFRDRLQIKPGLTGWAQINGGYTLKPGEKLKYDKYYISNVNYKLDLEILFKTIVVVITGEGAR